VKLAFLHRDVWELFLPGMWALEFDCRLDQEVEYKPVRCMLLQRGVETGAPQP
jgi:hypothetical protein